MQFLEFRFHSFIDSFCHYLSIWDTPCELRVLNKKWIIIKWKKRKEIVCSSIKSKQPWFMSHCKIQEFANNCYLCSLRRFPPCLFFFLQFCSFAYLLSHFQSIQSSCNRLLYCYSRWVIVPKSALTVCTWWPRKRHNDEEAGALESVSRVARTRKGKNIRRCRLNSLGKQKRFWALAN